MTPVWSLVCVRVVAGARHRRECVYCGKIATRPCLVMCECRGKQSAYEPLRASIAAR